MRKNSGNFNSISVMFVKTIIIFICFGTQLVLAQNGDYTINFKIENINGTSGVQWSGDCGSTLKSWLKFNDNSELFFFNQPVGDNQNLPRNWNTVFNSTKLLNRIRFDSDARKWHGGWNSGCESDYTQSNYNKYINYGVTEYYLSSNFTSVYTLRGTLKILPKLTITGNTLNRFLPTDDLIDIDSHKGFLYTEYNWQYSSDLINWNDLPQYNGSSKISLNANNILGANADDFVGQMVYLRQIAYQGEAKSSPVAFKVLKSAPHIVSVIPIETTCSDSEEGKLKIVFDRSLVPNEKLSLDFVDGNDIYDITNFDNANSYTVENVPKGNDTFNLFGFYKVNLFVAGIKHHANFTISSPTAVDFTIKKLNDVRCFEGNDGEVEITATGGVASGIYQYSKDHGVIWENFTNGTKHSIKGLSPGDCFVKVRKIKDANDLIGCIAKKTNGTEKEEKEIITQPSAPISINYTLTNHPTFFGATNGKIVAAVKGGTINDDKTYWYEWKNSNGDVLPTTPLYNNLDKTYNITLDNVPAGKYFLTVRDKNYDANKNNVNCTEIDSEKELISPDKLEVSFEIKKTISCNSNNVFGNDDDFNPNDGKRDESQDGILIAHVKGGVQLSATKNNGLPYYFYWKKQNSDNTWTDLINIKDSIANNLSDGNYALNIKDANGIVLGTYVNNKLETAIDSIQLMQEPPEFKIMPFDQINVSCIDGNNGSAKVNVSGGTTPYKSYTWYNIGTGIVDSDKATGLIADTYNVEVKDKKGCFTQGSVLITQPSSPISLEYTTIDNPKFSGATNGKLVVNVSGGTIKDDNSYGYLWKNSKGDILVPTTVFDSATKIYTITLDNLPADEYELTVWDKNYDATKPAQIVNCSVIGSKKTLEQPKPLVVTLEIKQTISCNAANPFGKEVDNSPKDGQRDESQDGILVAHVTGGVQLLANENNGLPYYFYWKKQQTDGTWIAWNDQDETAEHLSHGNYALNIKDRNGIVLGSYDVNNALIAAKDIIQFMKEPAIFAVSTAKGDVYCKGGIDGWATAAVIGGTTPYQYSWSNGETVRENTQLTAGEYSVTINDDKKCIAKDKVTIIEPAAPLTLNYTTVLNPSFYKATNGKIVVEVKGGTPFADKSYGYEWKNSAGVMQTAISQVNTGVFTLTLNGVPEDIYSLTIKDANYEKAGSKMGCTIINSQKSLDDPDPIVVTFEVQRTISCNVSNAFGNEIDTTPSDGQRDESQDGILMAHVSGGIPLDASQNNGLHYFYTWKKQLANGSWAVWNDHDETAEYLSNGIYALNVEDKNGIKLGTYVNNLLTQEIDVTQPVPEPDKLSLTFTKFDVGCTVGNDGWAKANVTGGTVPYTYQWTNEATTDKIENLTTNNYFVIVTDAKGCSVQGSIFVGDPNGIIATETTKNPTCFQGNDGFITLDVKGGNLPYTYQWNTGATTKDLTQLKAGNYEVAITCPDCCVYKKYFTLKDPNAIVVNLGLDRTLCLAQSLDVDATILDAKAQYSWTATNGFSASTPTVNLSKGGIYTVKVTSGLGCIGEDAIEIKTSNLAIQSEFLLSSQAYLDEEVILVNSSNPFGENTQWIIPEHVVIVEKAEKFITLKFSKAGVYTIGLKQTQGDCYATYSKNISVEQRSAMPNATNTNTQFVNDFIVSPNPNDGNFNALINLENNSPINLRLFSYNGAFALIQKKDSGKKKYIVDFDVKLATGVYVLVLETEQQTLVKKIIIY